MAMTLRIPEDLDAQLELLAAARHTSKHALIIEATAQLVAAEDKTTRATEIARGVKSRYAELLRRLEDA
jgi:predicted transcriptional regulator